MKKPKQTKIKKQVIKKHLQELGIKVVGNYVKRKDVKDFIFPKKGLVMSSTKVTASGAPSVYVGTYSKYNDGSIDGKWLNLENYKDEDEFYAAARELHKDEEDPELMFQDFENFPKRFYGESSLAKELWDWLELNEDDRELLEVYVDDIGDAKATIEDARDNFDGTYDSEEDWAENFLDEIGGLSPDQAPNYLYISDTDQRIIADEESDSYVSDNDDDQIVKDADMVDEYEAEEDETKKEAILEKAKDKVREEKYEEIEKELKEDPVGYFVDYLGYDIKDLMKASFVSIDYKQYARDASYEGISFVKKDGKVWVFRS